MPIPYIILMKVGPYCGYNLDEIIDIKNNEEKFYGHFYWGYGGVFCRPSIINNFIIQAKQQNCQPQVFFVKTESKYQTENPTPFTQFSADNNNWQQIPKKILLVGNHNKKHFAIVGNNLKKVNFDIDLNQYCVTAGMFPDPNLRLSKYFRYRVDKACGIYLSTKKELPPHPIHIDYSCQLSDPYCLYIK